MKNYAVFLHCKNLDVTHNDVKDIYGLFITIRVECENESTAGNKAVEFLKSEPLLAEAFSSGARVLPNIVVAVVHELPSSNKMKNTPYDLFLLSEE
jgi:hypothetical protein